jgi:hypothetical protein
MKARIDGFLNCNTWLTFPMILIIFLVIATSFPGKAQQLGPVGGSPGVPAMFSYQGVVKIDNQPYNGTGYFKFAILDSASGDGVNDWSNDGTTSGEPGSALGLNVSNGLFNLNLGDPTAGMTALPTSIFSDESRFLRVWFSSAPGGPFEALEPNQRIVSVPYALNAASLAGEQEDYYLNASNIYSGTLGTAYYSAYSDLQAEGKIGITTGQLATGDHVHYAASWSGSSAAHALAVYDTSGDTTHDALYGQTSSTYGVGVQGKATNLTGEASGVKGESQANQGRGVYGFASHTTGTNYGVYGETTSSTGFGVFGIAPNKGLRAEATELSGQTYGVFGGASSLNGIGVIANNFNDGVGLASYSRLGNILEGYSGVYNTGTPELVFKVDNDGAVYADQAYHCGLGIGIEPGNCIVQNTPADFAEMFPAVEGLEAGDVLVIAKDGKLQKSEQAYQSGVVGVYSTSPGYLGAGQHAGESDYAPLAIAGLVPVKASAENGAIEPGDLLVASATPGHAMKAGEDPVVGTVIGKAMQALDEERGTILMLVMLQ